MDLAPYVNKAVPFKFNGADLRLELSHALFSSFDIDRGTKLLLKAVARDPVLARARRVLDEGCGVGVIGLAIAKAFPEARVSMRDRDSLAVAFAERNRLANKLRDSSRASWGLLGSGDSSGPYDFVLSNLPAKAGGPALASFFLALTGKGGGSALLAPGGRAAIVIVEPLEAQAESWIAEAGLTIVERARGADHRVYLLDANSAASSPAAPDSAPGSEAVSDAAESVVSGLDLRSYIRSEGRFRLADLAYRAKGFWGLSEFDTPGFGSAVAAELASRILPDSGIGDILVIDPGVGHFALWASRVMRPNRVSAASRDLLALAATGSNIAGLPPAARPEYAPLDELLLDRIPEASFDLVVDFSPGVPEMENAGPAWERASRLLRPGGFFIASRTLGEMARLERRRPAASAGSVPAGSVPDGDARKPLWTSMGRRRKKGAVAAAWRKG